jgi:nitroimidazol reductase NimA-like FMN-containing flavoprotein (pyridoxamine 5'-phosphate oxidase superfamily)
MLGELTRDQIESILSSQALGRLACCVNNQPYIVPITYAYDGKYIYGQSNEGKKLEMMRQNPKVCFEVDMMVSMNNWKSVVVNGHFEELSEAEAAKAREVLFERVFTLQTSSTVHPHQHETSSQVDDSNRVKYIMYRIRIDSVSGRYEKQ